MKKTVLSLTVATALILSSCGGGGGFESDVRKAMKMECEVDKLRNSDKEEDKKKLEEKEKELDEFNKQMEEKHKNLKDDPKKAAKLVEIMMEEQKKCEDSKK